MSIEWSTPAEQDLLRIAALIRDNDPGLAGEVAGRIIKATEQLAASPGSGPPGRVPGTREKMVLGLPYILVYRTRGNLRVQILRVMHARQER
jgi:plasmid stabilization system protein ParE